MTVQFYSSAAMPLAEQQIHLGNAVCFLEELNTQVAH